LIIVHRTCQGKVIYLNPDPDSVFNQAFDRILQQTDYTFLVLIQLSIVTDASLCCCLHYSSLHISWGDIQDYGFL